MSTMSIRLPESIYRQMKEIARKEGVSMNQLVNSAIAEKVSAILTEDYLAERGKRGSREKYEAVLYKVAEAEPANDDKL